MGATALDLVQLQKANIELGSEQGARTATQAHWLNYILLFAAIAIAPLVFLFITRTTSQLRGVASGLAEGAEQITSASAQVASSSQTLAQGASEQAASLEETSASSEEITSMTRKNADNSKEAAGVMGGSGPARHRRQSHARRNAPIHAGDHRIERQDFQDHQSDR